MKLADQSVEREPLGGRRTGETNRRARRRSQAPDVIGCPAVVAIDRVRACGLNPTVEHQQADAPEQHGVVLAQEPPAAADVPTGATLAVWVGVPSPDLADDVVSRENEGHGAPVPCAHAAFAPLADDPPAGDADTDFAELDDGWYVSTPAVEPSDEGLVRDPEDATEVVRQADDARTNGASPELSISVRRWRLLLSGAVILAVAAILSSGALRDHDRSHAPANAHPSADGARSPHARRPAPIDRPTHEHHPSRALDAAHPSGVPSASRRAREERLASKVVPNDDRPEPDRPLRSTPRRRERAADGDMNRQAPASARTAPPDPAPAPASPPSVQAAPSAPPPEPTGSDTSSSAAARRAAEQEFFSP
jgi:hypothetical protein